MESSELTEVLYNEEKLTNILKEICAKCPPKKNEQFPVRKENKLIKQVREYQKAIDESNVFFEYGVYQAQKCVSCQKEKLGIERWIELQSPSL